MVDRTIVARLQVLVIVAQNSVLTEISSANDKDVDNVSIAVDKGVIEDGAVFERLPDAKIGRIFYGIRFKGSNVLVDICNAN